MIISACVIVKDDSELDNLKRAISSVVKYVDEVVVTANGSEVSGIKKYCLQNGFKYYYHKWNDDFSDQRNFCASKIRKDADFYLWFDSDDQIVGAENLRDIAIKAKRANLDSVFFEYWYMCTFDGKPSYENIKKIELTQMRERLLRPGAISWHKRLHETPVPNENIDYKYTQVKYKDTPIAWLHLGITKETSIEDQVAKTERNKRLLELQLEDERKTKEGADPRTLLYLMKIYAELPDMDLNEKVIQMGEEYLMKSGWDAERAICCTLIAQALGKKGQNEEAKKFLFKSIQEYPYDPILYLHLSRICYNLGQFREMKHWLEIALSLDASDTVSNVTNIGELKNLSTELLMKYYFMGERNVKKAYQSSKLLYKESPTKDNRETMEYLKELNDLEEASAEAHKLMLYYETLNNSQGIIDVVKSMPPNMQELPFAWHMFNKHKEPRVWREDEICYYASFGQKHFEQWGPDSLRKGIGGSETAVIQLSKEWVKNGYKVVVYCDCGKEEGEHDGVVYLPYYKFNPRDSFNIFINWRSNHLAGKIKAKKFIVDLHDLFNADMVKDYDKYDKLFVKSEFHRSLASSVPDRKIEVISNGI
jgi:tetratricopeptide (TPR) repeat protein